MNAIKRQTEAMRAAEAARAVGAEQTHKRGEVPAYLKRFQKQHAAEEAQKQREQEEARERARVPHGTRLVGPEEKEQLLSELRKSLQLELKRLNSFSVANDSMQLIKAREECERKIDQIEKTIREFERPGDLFWHSTRSRQSKQKINYGRWSSPTRRSTGGHHKCRHIY